MLTGITVVKTGGAKALIKLFLCKYYNGYIHGNQGIQTHNIGTATTAMEAKIINNTDFLDMLKPRNAATNIKMMMPSKIPIMDSALKPKASVIKASSIKNNQGTMNTEKHIIPAIIPFCLGALISMIPQSLKQ
jgi:hypothetical protein